MLEEDLLDAAVKLFAPSGIRRRYLLAYYDVEIDDPTNYHLVINVDRYTPQTLVRLVGDIVSKWSAGSDA